jgi:hypothetical protein
MSDDMEDDALKEWSVFVYICSDMPDRGLIDAAVADVSVMRRVGSSDKVGVVAQVDLPQMPTKRYVFPKRGTVAEDEFKAYELDRNVNTADGRNIVEFFEWANRKARAKNVFLILWGHGFGIDDFDPFLEGAVSSDTLGRANRDRNFIGITDNNGPFPLLHAPVRDATIARAALPDAGKQAFLKNDQIGRAVKGCREVLEKEGRGQKLAILGFDSCDMALLEVWFEMKDGPEIGIGSQYGIPFKGWPYAGMLESLNADPQMAPPELAKRVIKQFATFNDQKSKKPFVTLSACYPGASNAIADPLRRLAEQLAKESVSPAARAKIFDARNASPIFYEDGFIDLGEFCRHLQVRFPGETIEQYAGAVCEALPKYVLANSYAPIGTTKKISEATGVSLWFPPWIQHPDIEILQKEQSKSYFHNHYSATEFARDTKWHECLKAICQNSLYDAQFLRRH